MDTQSDSGSPDASIDSSNGKKARRQVAFYPNMNSSNKPLKPFSRSAAKRESVMALGSIEHLQHYFTKSGIAAESNPLLNKPNSGMVPAIGGLSSLKSRPATLQGIPTLALPPSPVVPEIVQPVFSPHHKTYETDPENLRPGVVDDLSAVEKAWFPNGADQPELLSISGSSKSTSSVDILDMLKTTTHAVRSVRNYLLSLPDDSFSPQQSQFRAQALPTLKPLRRQASQPNLASDPLSQIRAAALEVLIVLRALEESSRLPLCDDAYDAQSDHGDNAEHASTSGSGSTLGSGDHSRGPSPDFLDADVDTSISFVQVGGGLRSVPVWDDDESGFDMNHAPVEEAKERWDERLVLGGGWLYRQDIKRGDLSKEQDIVGRYLDIVDQVLFGGRTDGKRGWERERMKSRGKGSRRVSSGDVQDSPSTRSRSKRRVVSTGMLDAMKTMMVTEEPEEMETLSETESIEDDDLPEWARRSAFQDDPLARAYALLQALLPSSLQPLLPSSSSDRIAFLTCLASGQLPCIAYNVGVRRSRKPWGYVSKDAIHDIAMLESQQVEGDTQEQRERAKKGWTFRRTDNLRLWSAALKLRYMIPIITPNPSRSALNTPGNTPISSPSPSMQKFPTGEIPILFDAPVVARLDPGWEDMLETVVLKWVDAVVEERRAQR
ncbi:unnamed protein product [Somion occarium]|uniref:Uncharacterized protein n=1 Tax=Somion occarium TaxID=3059160 RepID=A0ABP1D610_9APHY